jgi:hypothetical protein
MQNGQPMQGIPPPGNSPPVRRRRRPAVEAAAVERIERILAYPGHDLEEGDVFQAPDVLLLAEQRFPDLEGPNCFLAVQSIRFEMDRFGLETDGAGGMTPRRI